MNDAASRSSGLSRKRLGRMRDVLAGYVERGALAGIVALLARRDEVHVEAIGAQDLATGAPIRRDTIFRIASMSKLVTSVAAMMLVEEAKLRLDQPVDRWLPELADRKVLRSIDSPLDDVVAAHRGITLRDLLTFRLGLGAVMAPPGRYPIQQALADTGLAPGPGPVAMSPDDYMARAGSLPLMHQPGDKWMYHTGSDILGVLIARVTGMGLGEFLAARIFAPLGMADTGFSIADGKVDRLATCYQRDGSSGSLVVYDPARGGQFTQPPIFPAGGGGLVSTANDFLAFSRMMLRLGRCGDDRLLARPTIELMVSDQLTAEQKAASPFFPGFWDNRGWGFGVAVTTQRDGIAPSPGSYGWMGGFGTSFCIDPREDLVAILLTQRLMTGPNDTDISDDFLTLAYQAIDD
jgi:CubicO group peptidase (beta-lactamase class C family)